MNIDRKVEIAFGGSFYDDPTTLTWTDLSDSWTDDPTISVKLGRDPDLAATPQAGTCHLRLTALDGAGVPNGALTPGNAASPYYPNVVSGVPVRITAQDSDGTWWPVFYGLSESWTPSQVGNLADWSVVDLVCSTAWTALTQAGPRRTYADRVVGDLAPAKGEVWMAGDAGGTQTDVMYVAGGVIYPGRPYIGGGALWPDAYEPGVNSQRWGFAWCKLDNTGSKTWATPGAACPVVETGGADLAGGNAALTAFGGGFASDRAGGQYQLPFANPMSISAGAQLSTGGSSNFSRMQAFIGRPPTQLAPASVSEPTSTAGWTPSAGAVTLVASSTLPHLPRTTAYDPTTGVTAAAVVAGPANAIQWVPTGANTLTSAPIPVSAGEWYGPILIGSGSTLNRVQIQWLDAGSVVLSTSVSIAALTNNVTHVSLFGRGAPAYQAPTGAVTARLLVTTTGTGTVTVGCVGFYKADALGATPIGPARWWPIGADAKIWAWVQWPDLTSPSGMTTGTAGQIRWMHVAFDVTSWDDASLHMIGWNGWPGVAGKPVVWADGARITSGWSVSYPDANVGSDTTHAGVYNGSEMAGGFGSSTGARAGTTNPSKLVVPAALLGAYRYEVTPDDTSIGRAYSFFGGRKSLAGTTYAGDTGAQLTQALDQLGWPDALRDITTGASQSGASWADMAGLSDYSALISDLTKVEYGWVDIGPDGKIRWLPRAWYGVGTATAAAHYTWRQAVAGAFTYVPPLVVLWDDKYTYNSIVVSNGIDVMTRSRQDIAAQRRGLRRLSVAAPFTTQASVDAVADILAAVYKPGPRIEALTLLATQNDLPAIKEILSRKTGDVILVDIPQQPAADLSVGMLITKIEHSSDGITWTAILGLSPCPIPVTFP